MKRFKNILYIVDDKSLRWNGSAEKVANLARLNEASVTALIADETTLLDDLSLKISGRYDQIKEAIHRQNSEDLAKFINHKRWSDIAVAAADAQSDNFISIIQRVMRDGHDLLIKEESLERGIDQLAMRLVRKCPSPVWVIKRGSGDFRRILAAVDVGAEYPETRALNQKIVELAYSLGQREQGETHYLHTWRLEYESMLSGPRFNISQDEISEMKKKLYEERLLQLRQLLDWNHIQCQDEHLHINEGLYEDVMKKAIVDFEADVVVMGSVGRSGIPGLLIGNKAEKLLNTINCTVLTVKPDGFVSPITLS